MDASWVWMGVGGVGIVTDVGAVRILIGVGGVGGG